LKLIEPEEKTEKNETKDSQVKDNLDILKEIKQEFTRKFVNFLKNNKNSL
jgi:flagellar motor switch protein FliM